MSFITTEDEGSSNLIPIVIVMLILAIMIIFFCIKEKEIIYDFCHF